LTHTTECHRCGQPGQQHGRRIPSLSSEHTLSTCWCLVSSFLTEMVQQIHSLRASGVMSSQAASAFASDVSAFRRSAGRLCTTPPEIRTVVMARSRRLMDQASDTRVQLGLRDHRRPTAQNPGFWVISGMPVTRPESVRSAFSWLQENGRGTQRRLNSRPLYVAYPQAILIVYLFFNLPSWGFHPRGSLIAPYVHFSRGTKL
jgi:hypothetical protein